MRYLPILEELCSSDSVLLMVAGVIVALVISVKFCDTKRNLIGLIGSFVVYAICEVLTNFYTNYMLEIALLFAGTLALGAFIGFLIGSIVSVRTRKAGTLTMEIRTASLQDLEDIAAVEAACFPVAEAATKAEFAERIQHYGDHFFLLYDKQKLIAFVDGFVTDEQNLTDEMYEKASLHNENGAWQMIFGVNTLPAYRQHGYAGKLLQKAIADAKEQCRKGLVLTCKSRLVHYYAKFGFVDEGVTDKSTHGNVAWHQMRLTF